MNQQSKRIKSAFKKIVGVSKATGISVFLPKDLTDFFSLEDGDLDFVVEKGLFDRSTDGKFYRVNRKYFEFEPPEMAVTPPQTKEDLYLFLRTSIDIAEAMSKSYSEKLRQIDNGTDEFHDLIQAKSAIEGIAQLEAHLVITDSLRRGLIEEDEAYRDLMKDLAVTEFHEEVLVGMLCRILKTRQNLDAARRDFFAKIEGIVEGLKVEFEKSKSKEETKPKG